MANGNNSGLMVRVLLIVLVLTLGAVGTLVVMGADSLTVHMDRIEIKVDTVEQKQISYDIQQARVALQLSVFAVDKGLVVVVDIIVAMKVLDGDSL